MFHLLIATTNPGKVKEVKALLKSSYIKISSLEDFSQFSPIKVKESGDTFFDNALIKAQTFGRLSGLPTLADDSGLSVDALGGRPGVQSARYADTDPAKITKLLSELQSVPADKRQAHFTCALVLYDPSSDKHYSTEGMVDGLINSKPQGDHGFGYDPVFYYPPLKLTFGQLEPETKNQISHRSLALAKMKKIIAKRCR